MDTWPRAALARTVLVVCAGAFLLGAVAPSAGVNQVESLIEQGELALRRDAEQGRRLAEQALAQLDRNPQPDQELRARLILCEYFAERDSVAAVQQITAMQRLLGSINRVGLRAGLLTCRGEEREAVGANADALALYEQAVSAGTSSNDDEMLAGALHSRGFLHSLQGNYALGLADLRKAQQLYDKVAMPLHAMTSLNAIATTYSRMGDYAQSQSLYKRGLQMQREAGLTRDQIITEHNIGRVSERLGAWDEARRAYESSLTLSRSLGYGRGEAYALRGLAAITHAQGKSRESLDLLQAASSLQQQTPDARLGAMIALARGKALRSLSDTAAARVQLSQALEVFRTAGAQGELVNTYEELAATDSALGDWRRAFQWQEAAKTVSEQLLRSQIDQQFGALKVEFDTATREKEYEALLHVSKANELALKQSSRARTLQYVVFALAVLLASVLALLALHHNRNSQRMRKLALTDELTGVPNRRSVLALLPTVLQDIGGRTTAALIVDIDHFKSINDSVGHAIGDRVLRLAADRMRASLVPPEFFGRIGGEEFLVVIPGVDMRSAILRAETLRQRVAAADISMLIPELKSITVSIGIAISRPDDTASTILQRADTALYRAKGSGRNRVVGDSPLSVTATPHAMRTDGKRAVGESAA
jgi:diguanylate cyclase (GGDEF)-like protein